MPRSWNFARRNPAFSRLPLERRLTGTPLDVAILAHVRHRIAQPFMGGMETHTWHLVQGLALRGHRVRLLASGDSDAHGTLVPIVACHYEVAFPWHVSHGTDVPNAHLDAIYSHALLGLSRDRPEIVHNNALDRYPSAWSAIRRADGEHDARSTVRRYNTRSTPIPGRGA